MGYKTETELLVNFLNEKASEGFLSEPVTSLYSENCLAQRVTFSLEDKLRVRQYLAKYHPVLSRVDYPTDAMFGEEDHRTASLLTMLAHMLSDSGPEYVSANASRLLNALETHKENFDSLVFEQEFNC